MLPTIIYPHAEVSEVSSTSALVSGIAVAAFVVIVGCVVALLVGILCHRKYCRRSTPRWRNNRQTPIRTYPLASFPTVDSNTDNSSVNVPGTSPYATATTAVSPDRTRQHLEAATHSGEAPPTYRAAANYKTMALEDYDSSLKPTDSDNIGTDAPPTYSEIVSGQEENHAQTKT